MKTEISTDTTPEVKILPPVIFAVVVILVIMLKPDTTLPLRLKPAAFKLPPITLPVTLAKPVT